MKKLFLDSLNTPDSCQKTSIFFENKKSAIRLRNLKSSLYSLENINTNSDNKFTASTFNYPISESIYFKTTTNLSSFSPILSQRTTKNFFNELNLKTPEKKTSKKKKIAKTEKKTIETLTLQFNKRLRLFMNLDEQKQGNKKFIEIVKKNIEDMYFDYDKKNVEKKKNLFSGNNAGILKNKVLFVKGVMDYMFPILTIQKMHYLDEEKHKKFKEEMERAKSLNQNNIYKKRIYSAKHIVRNCKYKYNGVFSSDFSRKTQLINKEKKILIGGKKKIMNLHKYDFY